MQAHIQTHTHTHTHIQTHTQTDTDIHQKASTQLDIILQVKAIQVLGALLRKLQ